MFPTAFRRLAPALLLAAMVAAAPVRASEAVFPPGSRLGLVPTAGLVPSHAFIGFEDRANQVAVLMSVVPKEAYETLTKSASPEALTKQGLTGVTSQDLSLPFGKATLIAADQQVGNVKLRKFLLLATGKDVGAVISVPVPEAARSVYSDEAIRRTLTTLAVRDEVPVAEQMSLLPFKIRDLAGFKIGNTVPNRAILLTDAAPPTADTMGNPRMAITAIPGAPPTDDRDSVARQLFQSLPGIQIERITNAEPLRIGGQQGYQVMAVAKDARSQAEITVVQWLRFGSGGVLHMVGSAPTKQWNEAYARFRKVRDAVDVQ